MLMLSLELQVGPGRAPLPAHLGGVLHGFVEGGVKNHAPHLLPVLRPNGPHEAAHFMILPPPAAQPAGDILRFGVMLYGDVAAAWPVLARALLEQQAHGLHGRRMRIDQAWCANPGGEAFPLLARGQLLEFPEGPPIDLGIRASVARNRMDDRLPGHHRLSFRSPLLLASRKAQRTPERLASGLPWPSLGAVLDSIADRMRDMEPELARVLNLPAGWRAPDFTRDIEPLTPAANPARQVAWDYTSTPRNGHGGATQIGRAHV